MAEEPVGVVIGTPLTSALSKLRWAAEGEWSAYVTPEECSTLLEHLEGLSATPPEPEPDPEPALEPAPEPAEQREIFTLYITGEGGRVIHTAEVGREEFESLVGDADESRTYVTGTGQKIVNTHDPVLCEGRACVIHNPSAHYMADFPTHWRADRGIMERICPHGVGHPDPDDMAFIRSTRGDDAASAEGVHGCDGCCTPVAHRHPTLKGNANA
jgi:hypothetical protein